MRKELEGRPLLGILAALIAGLTAPQFPLNLALIAGALWLWSKLETRLWITAALLVGVLIAPLSTPPASSRSGEFIAEVTSVPRIYEDAISFETEVAGYRLLARIPGDAKVRVGDRLSVRAKIVSRQAEDRFLESKGLQGRLFVTSYRVLAKGSPIYGWADDWRRSFLAFAKEGLPTKAAHMVSALCFNTDSLLDDDTKESLRRTGTIHIVSVSGMHIFVLAVSLLWALSQAPIPRWIQLSVLALALSFYAITVGLNAPVVRAVIMALVGAVAYLFGREKDWLSALAIAAIVNLLWQPRSIYDMGFQLSFVTVAAFVMYLPKRRETESSYIAGQLKSVFAASAVASGFSAPLVAYHFGQVPILGIVANLLIALPVSIIVISALVAHGIWLIAPQAGLFILDWVAGSLTGFVDLILKLVGQVPWGVLSFPESSGYFLALFYALVILTSWRPIVRQP